MKAVRSFFEKNQIICRWGQIAVPAVTLVAVFIMNLRFILHHGVEMINADIASEMVLAKLLNREHRLVSTNWFYSTEIRILDANIFLQPGALLFPEDWHMARVVAVILAMSVLVFSSIYLCYTLKLPLWCRVLYAAFAICPVGKWYGWNVIYHLYYVSHIATTMIVLGLFFRALNIPLKTAKGRILLGLLAVISFISGLGGIRRLMICYAPLWLASAAYLFHASRTKWKDDKVIKKNVLLSSVAIIAALIGFVFYKLIIMSSYHVAASDQQRWKLFSIDSILACLSDFFNSYGWRYDAPILSALGIFNVLSVFLVLGMLVSGFKGIVEKEEEYNNGKMMCFFCAMVFLISLLVFSAGSVYNASYWTPLIPLMVLPFLMWVCNQNAGLLRILLMGGMCCYLLYATTVNIRDPYIDWVRNGESIMNVSSWLVENDYQYGFAEFWSSNTVTELTDGEIEMWTLKSVYNPEPYLWLQETRHADTLPEQAFFLIESTDFSQEWFPWGEVADYMVYYDDNYAVFYPPTTQTWFDMMEQNPYVKEVSTSRVAMYQ